MGKDVEKIVKALRYCDSDDWTDCKKCVRFGECCEEHRSVDADAADMIERLSEELGRVKQERDADVSAMKLKRKNIDLVRENAKLRKERDRLKNEIDELREKLDEAKLGLIWYSMLDKVGELIDENERLKDKTYNLTLYLHEVRNAYVMQDRTDDVYRVWEYLDEQHPEIPGYNPAILEARNE